MFKKGKRSSDENRVSAEMHYRRAKMELEPFINRCRKLSNEYFEKGKKAAAVNNPALMRQFALGYKLLTEKQLAAENILLSLEMLNLDAEQNEVSKSFLGYAGELASTKDRKKDWLQAYEFILKGITTRDKGLAGTIDAIGDRTLIPADPDLDDIIAQMKGEGAEVEKKLDSIIEMMKDKRPPSSPKDGGSGEQAKLKELLDLLEQRKKGAEKNKKGKILSEIEERMKEIEKHIGKPPE